MNTESKKVLAVKFETYPSRTMLVGTVDRFNNAKRAELNHVKHSERKSAAAVTRVLSF